MPTQRSAQLFRQAQQLIPGGVNSPVRAWQAVDLCPPFIARAQGATIYDVEGQAYLDFVGSWGPMIVGHAHPQVVAAVQQAAANGTSFGAPTPGEVELAQRLTEAVPGLEMVRLVNSGTEAAMSALRLARGYTGRPKIIKFDGGYHGHADTLLVQAGSGILTQGIPGSPGIPAAIAELTISVPYNDLEAVRQAILRNKGQIAALIVEPVAGNMGIVAPQPDFLPGLRHLCTEHDIILIFDEVITGFRVAWEGAQGRYGVIPDLTCLGKIIGGGLPVGAYGGRREIMTRMAPSGPIYQAGTLSGNPLAVAAGLATLEILRQPGVYDVLEHKGRYLETEIKHRAAAAGVPITLNRVGSMLTVFFTDRPVTNLAEAQSSDLAQFRRFFQELLVQGIYLPPSQFEAWFISLAHGQEQLEATVAAVHKVWSAW
ncbi:MAG: glutamate-1-semialdehyde 2,1-aminomutase [Deltaproteobacteria bacterium]|nr:glutamate-1-semialdehyde 2,1-aminomutase [Deltaproteobacteria bacterium]MBW1951802.1 glutamate-1-semialdehyde 2,1-aminomutase [Deltaproteobacteria bacterium]MBW1985632.1 glutamate-1-semialdehyde 2,1-aminomutase [Deltaproteobacteria bacterium]MBW2134428.1 glutamate-1-semialdehyde 2,1-aminomutase [Deltaproteobacteria bacterium]